MFLIEMNVISKLRKACARKADSYVVAWFSGQDVASFYISFVKLMELYLGILLLEWHDTGREAGCAHGWTIMAA